MLIDSTDCFNHFAIAYTCRRSSFWGFHRTHRKTDWLYTNKKWTIPYLADDGRRWVLLLFSKVFSRLELGENLLLTGFPGYTSVRCPLSRRIVQEGSHLIVWSSNCWFEALTISVISMMQPLSAVAAGAEHCRCRQTRPDQSGQCVWWDGRSAGCTCSAGIYQQQLLWWWVTIKF